MLAFESSFISVREMCESLLQILLRFKHVIREKHLSKLQILKADTHRQRQGPHTPADSLPLLIQISWMLVYLEHRKAP